MPILGFGRFEKLTGGTPCIESRSQIRKGERSTTEHQALTVWIRHDLGAGNFPGKRRLAVSFCLELSRRLGPDVIASVVAPELWLLSILQGG